MQGALAMAADSCFHGGCGLLSLFAPKEAGLLIAAKSMLYMLKPASEDENGFFAGEAGEELRQIINQYTLIGCGSGMGRGDGAAKVLKAVLESHLPAVIDADGLSLLAENPKLIDRDAGLILTPHPGEFARLMHLDAEAEDFFEQAEKFSSLHPNAVLVLKGETTLVIQGQRKALLHRPDSALAKGGSGDVLYGLICSLAAQMEDPFEAAVLGVWMHNEACKNALSPRSFTPLQLIEQYGPLFHRLEMRKEKLLHQSSSTL